jgi:hypothetical protein
VSGRKAGKKTTLEIREVLGPPGVWLEGLEPASAKEVHYFVELAIGRRGEKDEARFDLTVATPEALLARATPEASVLSDRALLVVSHWDWDAIRAHLDEILARCEAPTLHDAIPLLQRYFRWEYEDYKP